MKELIKKFQKIEQELSQEKGEFELFALFQTDFSINKWDVVIAAPWIIKNKNIALYLIVEKIKKELKENLIKLSKVVLIDENNLALKAVQQAVHTEHNSVEILNSNFFGLQIKHAFIITSKKIKQ
ncbi:MAG: hypothetical protein WC460_06125 [Patescibacteria group bacterium]